MGSFSRGVIIFSGPKEDPHLENFLHANVEVEQGHDEERGDEDIVVGGIGGKEKKLVLSPDSKNQILMMVTMPVMWGKGSNVRAFLI